MKDTLILFDVNGTIIEKDKETDIAYVIAVKKLFNNEKAFDGVDNTARSDLDVFHEITENLGVPYSDDLWAKFNKIYVEELKKIESKPIWRENRNVKRFIADLVEKEYPITLITGELEIGAEYKLTKVGVWDYFKTGGFGEDARTRFETAEVAVKRAEEQYGVKFERMVLIGDTILDVETADHVGAEIISVKSESIDPEKLKEAGSKLIIDDFNELRGRF